METAKKICFKTLRDYLSPTSTFDEAGAALLHAAADIYGKSSKEWREV